MVLGLRCEVEAFATVAYLNTTLIMHFALTHTFGVKCSWVSETFHVNSLRQKVTKHCVMDWEP